MRCYQCDSEFVPDPEGPSSCPACWKALGERIDAFVAERTLVACAGCSYTFYAKAGEHCPKCDRSWSG